MKLKKLLTPILTTIGTAAIATPLVCLTSCAGDTEEKAYFTLAGGENKEHSLTLEPTAGSEIFKFNYIVGATIPDSVEANAVIKSASSNINIEQCYCKTVSGQLWVYVDYWCKHDATGTSETTFNIKFICTEGSGKDAKTYQQVDEGYKFTLEANK